MMVIELKEKSNSNNNNNNSISSLADPVPAEQLSNYTVEDILKLYITRGVAVTCVQCGNKYVDRKEKDVWTFDFSICPKCMGFNSFKEYIFGDGEYNRRRRRKVLISRIFMNTTDLIKFLNNRKYDFPNEINVIVTIKFNSKEEAISYLTNYPYSREVDAVIEG